MASSTNAHAGTKVREERRWWIVPLILGSLLSQGLAIPISGRSPNVLAFDIFLILTLGWLSFELLLGKFRFHSADGLVTWLFIALLLCQIVSLLLNEKEVPRGLYEIKVSLFAFLSYLVVTVLIGSRKDWLDAVYSLVLWGGVVGLLLTVSFFSGWAMDLGPEAGYSVKDEVGIGLGRSNYVAAMLVLIVPIGICTVLSYRGLRRLLVCSCTGLMTLGLLITMSKGAFIALGFGIICSIPCMVRRGLKFRQAVMFLAALGLFFAFVPGDLLMSNVDMFVYRFANPDLQRVDLWRTAWATFTQHPLLGVGPGAVSLYNQQFAPGDRDTHNFVLQSLAELGLIGTIPFLFLLGTLVTRAYRLCMTPVSDESGRLVPAGLFGGLLATLAHGLVEPTFPGQQYAVVFWLCMALVFVFKRESS